MVEISMATLVYQRFKWDDFGSCGPTLDQKLRNFFHSRMSMPKCRPGIPGRDMFLTYLNEIWNSLRSSCFVFFSVIFLGWKGAQTPLKRTVFERLTELTYDPWDDCYLPTFTIKINYINARTRHMDPMVVGILYEFLERNPVAIRRSEINV